MSEFGRVRKCPVCGKEFILGGEDWAYKKSRKNAGYIYMCSWRCYRKYETQNTSHSDLIRQAILRGCSDEYLRKTFKLNDAQIKYHRIKVGC